MPKEKKSGFHFHFYGGRQWKIVATGNKTFVVDSSYRGADKSETEKKMNDLRDYEIYKKNVHSYEGFQERMRGILKAYYTDDEIDEADGFIYLNDDVIRTIKL